MLPYIINKTTKDTISFLMFLGFRPWFRDKIFIINIWSKFNIVFIIRMIKNTTKNIYFFLELWWYITLRPVWITNDINLFLRLIWKVHKIQCIFLRSYASPREMFGCQLQKVLICQVNPSFPFWCSLPIIVRFSSESQNYY